MQSLEQKKIMSSFDVSAIVMELRQSIIGKYLDNIYQLNEKTFLLKFRPENQSLIIEVGKRIHLTNYSITVPSAPTQFSMTLRRHLRNGKTTDITQYHFERIVVMQVDSPKGRFQLVAEFFGRGNLVLIGPDSKVILALRYAKMRDRDIVRGVVFTHAPLSGLNPLETGRSDLESLKSGEPMSAVRKITKLLAIGGLHAREILLRAGVNEAVTSNLLSETQLDGIYRAIKSLVSDLQRDRMSPQILLDQSGSFLSAEPFPLDVYKNMRKMSYETFNQAADEYFSRLAAGLEESEAAKRREQEREKFQRILNMQIKERKTVEAEAARCTRIGEMIKRHTQEISDIATRIQTRRSRGDSFSEISKLLKESAKEDRVPHVCFVDMDPKNRTFSVRLEGEEFSVNLEETPHRNASNYFDRAKSLKQKLQSLDKSIAKTRSELESFEAKLEKETREGVVLVKKMQQEWYERFRWFESSEGFLVLAGRDASTNEILISRYTKKDDIVFHAEVQGAPFVVVKTGGKALSEQTIAEAAIMGASYSKAWSGGFSSVDVFWVRPEQLSKKPPSGQYIEKGMFMVYGPRNYVKGVSLRIAIGMLEKEGGLKLIGGPRTAVEKKTPVLVELVPGRTRSAALAKKIVYELSKKVSGDAAKIMKILRLDEVQRLIPAGTGDLVK